MKFQSLKKLLVILCVALIFSNCQTNDEDLIVSKIRITDFKESELVKMHGGSEKAWKLTKVILPEQYKEYPTVLNSDCVSDDTYTFKASNTNRSLEHVAIELGTNRCFKTISDSEKFEAKLLYVPYILNGEKVIETTLVLKYSGIKDSNNSTITNIDSYRLSELTENKMVFSTGAEFVGDYTFAYVFEKK